jgi:hypothetical protein
LNKAVRILPVLMLSLSLSAQLSTGDLRGKAVDKEGKPLSGVKVTLSKPQSPDEKTVTEASGFYRFPSVHPGSDYGLKFEREDFKTVTLANIVVTVGGTVAIDVILQPGNAEEQVALTGSASVIDRTKMTGGAVFGRTELQTLPTARDPWAIAQLAPGVMLDRETVGGDVSGEQASIVAKGDFTNGAANVWTIDGIDVTDPLSLGASTVAYDFDTLEAVAVTTGGAADVVMPTGGIALNLVTRRGDNAIGGSARFYLTDGALQSDNLTDELRDGGVSYTNRIRQFRDYGLSVGGPIVKNRVWWWGSYGVQDLDGFTIYNTPDRTLFGTFSFKVGARPFAGNRLEAMYMASSKEKFGLNASAAKPEGDHQSGRYRLGSPVFKLQDEQTFGNDLYLSMKFTAADTGTTTRPVIDEDLQNIVTWDVANGIYVPYSSDFGRSWDSSTVVRKRNDLQMMASLYRESLFGLPHEIKAGFEFSGKKATSLSGYAQNFTVLRNFAEPLIDLGEGLVVPPSDWQYIRFERENREVALLDQASFFLQDTVVKGRLAMTLGLRYDRQAPSTGAYTIAAVYENPASLALFDSESGSAVASSIPPLHIDAVKAKYRWSTWSPRLGLSWDLSGDGRTVVKLALARYGDILEAGAKVVRPLGLDGGMGFWWTDANLNGSVGTDEIYWQYSALHPESPYALYGLFDVEGFPTDAAEAALEGGFESDAYLAGNYWDYDFLNPNSVNYDNLTTFYRSDVDPDAKNVKTSPRTREIMLSLERELRPDLAASVTATYRRYDNFDWAKPFYPADVFPSTPDLVVDNTQTWYTEAGTIPDAIIIDGVSYDMGDAAGRPWYLPNDALPGYTPYRMVDKSTAYRTYFGIDLALTKRLSHRWFMNASITLQGQRHHWGDSFIDPTNQWALDGKAYGNLGGGSVGATSMLMHSRWLTKISGLYQLPWGVSLSATLVAREGWKIPNYVTLAYAGDEAWPGLYKSNVVYLQAVSKDRLPVFHNLSFRMEKSITFGGGRMHFMVDVFNLLNSGIVNRAYDAYLGTYYVDTGESVANPTNRLYSEVLNPRVWRLGVRFEF